MTRYSGYRTDVPPDYAEDEELNPVERLLGRNRRPKSKRPHPLARVLEQSSVTQPTPASSHIQRRRGLLGTNRIDQAVYDAAKWNEDIAYTIAQVPVNTARIGVHSFTVATKADEYMLCEIVAGLPPELQEDAETLAYAISDIIAVAGKEATKMYPELANKVIAELYNNKAKNDKA
jgi:hypothetical protein